MAAENGSARIGKSIVIRGEVKGGEDLTIDGRVEGTVQLAENRLTIGPNANVAADLTAKDVLVLGKVQGNVVATGRVELRAGCVLEGDVRAFRLAIEDNAVLRGKVDLTQAAAKPGEVAAPAAGIS
ncbi:MAG TPA: polymer-forming cytoskeletal protein [Terracidiphilus sp.]|jgi:cytoskeletal protein CcmA (bactofilin family)|nr:polymer-forming cytoskeletal protein [Terracidiphilus sp.]